LKPIPPGVQKIHAFPANVLVVRISVMQYLGVATTIPGPSTVPTRLKAVLGVHLGYLSLEGCPRD
jgi:hypothetical protein